MIRTLSHFRVWLAVGLVGTACSLNPQPEPPAGRDSNASGGQGGGSGGAAAGGASSGTGGSFTSAGATGTGGFTAAGAQGNLGGSGAIVDEPLDAGSCDDCGVPPPPVGDGGDDGGTDAAPDAL